jgi:phosphatidate cytidylyltransferase
MTASPKWQDLLPRILSAVVLIAAGAVEIYYGGWLFKITVCAVCGIMMWEAARMFDAPRPRADGALAGLTLLIATMLPAFFIFPLVLASAFVSSGRAGKDRLLFFVSYVWILTACLAIILLRDLAGFEWFLWCICVIAATDIAGYFAGRLIGGPKFWPSVSPKKTWSGTATGWLAAACVGWALMATVGSSAILIVASVIVSFASQMGDIAESAVKRRAGVKDSSSLIPGHGGVLDRFDGVMGGGFAALLIWLALITGVTA